MFGALKEKAQKASAAASAAVKQKVEAAKGAMSSDSSSKVKVDPTSLAQLCGMGFTKPQAEAALARVGGQDVEAAIALHCHREDEVATAKQGSSEAQHQPLLAGGAGVSAELLFALGQSVEVHSMGEGQAAKKLNGKVGQVISYAEEQGRFLVDFAGEPKLIRAENLREVSAAVKAKAQMQASLKSAKASMNDAKQRAEAFFGKSSGSRASSSTQPAAAAAHGLSEGRTLGSSTGAPTDPSARRAALEAAERRLAEARARNSGTMEDYRRWQREQLDAQRGAPRAPQGRPMNTIPIGEPVLQRSPDEARGDEEEDLQRALEASLVASKEVSPAAAAAAAAADVSETHPEPSSEDVQLQQALAASLAEARGGDSAAAAQERPSAGADSSASAAAAQDAGSPLRQAEDPEVFELQLQQAMAEEELQLQRVLAESISAEREALESACAEAGSDLASETLALAGARDPAELARELEDRRLQEEQALQEQAALEGKLLQLKTEVAMRDDVEGTGAPAEVTIEPADGAAVQAAEEPAEEPAGCAGAQADAEPADGAATHAAAQPADGDAARVGAEPAAREAAQAAAEPVEGAAAEAAPEPADGASAQAAAEPAVEGGVAEAETANAKAETAPGTDSADAQASATFDPPPRTGSPAAVDALRG